MLILEQNYYQFLQPQMKKSQDIVRKKLEDYSYVLCQNIGKGYSSQVFKGRNDLTDEIVAIKVIDMKKINNQVHKNLLASEIQVLKTLKNCENILEVYDIYNTKNNTYIITELCEGGDLSKHISNKKSIPQSEAITLMNQIIKGYIQMQNKGIVHRDLKPANIFMRNSEIKIADFGFAMKQNDCKKYSSYNVGSPVYMPPQALNDNKYSFKSDIWALGVIYYEMLTGKTPWRAKTQKQLARLLTSVPIKKLMPPSISNSSEIFLLRTLAVDINQRMSPQEINRFSLNKDRVHINRQLFSTQNSGFDGKNNIIRNQQSLNKNSIMNPMLKKVPMNLTNEQFKQKYPLPKTAATISNKTENYIQTSNKSINDPLTQKQINTHHHIISQINHYDKRILSKQLLSQIHLCRFIYKLCMRMGDRLSEGKNEELHTLKEYMCGVVFQKLEEVAELKQVSSKFVEDFKISPDYAKISQIVQQYESKYQKDLSQFSSKIKPLSTFKDQLTKNIILIYNSVSSQLRFEQDSWKEQVIVLDYLVTLRQLINILQHNDLQGFHNKSKIQNIVQGNPSKNITEEHLNAIKSKLKAIKII